MVGILSIVVLAAGLLQSPAASGATPPQARPGVVPSRTPGPAAGAEGRDASLLFAIQVSLDRRTARIEARSTPAGGDVAAGSAAGAAAGLAGRPEARRPGPRRGVPCAARPAPRIADVT